MQEFLQVAVIGVVTVVFAALLKRNSGELAILLTIGACVLMGVLIVRMTEPVLTFLGKLRNLAGLDTELMTPLLKTVGIGLLTQLAASVCTDAGESAIAKLIELCGSVLAIYLALTLLEAVIDLIQSMSGG